ncbi:MAG: hypothetical protein RLZ12_345 [Bacillota bacterium]|jgi:large subunit ribosomal protein L17
MAYSKLGRNAAARRALFRDLATDLIINERIKITEAKAKELRGFVDKLITFGKAGDLHSRRLAAAFIRVTRSNTIAEGEKPKHNKRVNAVQKLFNEIAPRYKERAGGYTRILKLNKRRGDGAPIVLMELIK